MDRELERKIGLNELFETTKRKLVTTIENILVSIINM